MKTKSNDDWEKEIRQKYEGANIWSSKAVDDLITVLRNQVKNARQEGYEEGEKYLGKVKREAYQKGFDEGVKRRMNNENDNEATY